MLPPHLLDGPRAPVIVALIALIAAAAGIFTMPVLDRDEARFAQATAQMLETGDLVEINFLDEARNKKPVGIHWLQAMAVQLTTGEDARAIWAYRIPSVLGAVLAALFAFYAGARLFGREAGFAGAVMIAVSVLLATEGGIAKTDSMLGATAAGAFLALVMLRTRPSARDARWASVLFWVCLGLGALIKGPVTPMAGGLAIAALFAYERRFDWARPLLWWPGPVLAVLIVLPWLIAIQVATGGAFLLEAVGDDMGAKVVSGDEGHDGPPGYHLLLLPVLFLPAILTLPAGIRAALRDWRGDSAFANAVRTVIAFVLPTWLAFEILPTKLPHYTLPTYAALAALAGLGLSRLQETPALWRWLGAALAGLGFIVAAPGILIFAHLYGDLSATAALTAGVVIALPTLAAMAATGLARPGAALVLAIVAGLSWHVGLRGMLAPHADAFFVSQNAAQTALGVQERVPTANIVSTFTEPSLVFTLGGAVGLTDPAALVLTEIDAAQPRVYIIDESRWLRSEYGPISEAERDLRRSWLLELQQTACVSTAADGINYSRGDEVIAVFILATGCVPEPALEPNETTP